MDARRRCTGYWPQPPGLLAHSLYIGPAIITEAEWRAIWEATVLEARTIQAHGLETGQEVRARIKWVGRRSVLLAWGRLLKLLLTNPRSRGAIREQLDAPTEMTSYVGYALFVGRKPLQPGGRQGD